jgi:hypothetical protein
MLHASDYDGDEAPLRNNDKKKKKGARTVLLGPPAANGRCAEAHRLNRQTLFVRSVHGKQGVTVNLIPTAPFLMWLSTFYLHCLGSCTRGSLPFTFTVLVHVLVALYLLPSLYRFMYSWLSTFYLY